MDTVDDPVVQAKQLIAEARQQFAKDVDALLASGRIELRQVILERFNDALPMHRLADPVLLRLVREARELLMSPEPSVSLTEWLADVEPFTK